MNNCYSLTGPYPLYVTADPIGTGKVKINSLTISDFPWTGNYHGGIDVKISAYPDTLNGFSFGSWETYHNTPLPSAFTRNAQLQLTSGDTLIAHFTQQPVGVNEISGTSVPKAFPNVFSDQTQIEFYQSANNANLVLYSVTGEPVLTILGKSVKGMNSF